MNFAKGEVMDSDFQDESDIVQVIISFFKSQFWHLSSTCAKVRVRQLEAADYQLAPTFTKEFSLVGKNKKSEKLKVMERPSLFNKNFKVASETLFW